MCISHLLFSLQSFSPPPPSLLSTSLRKWKWRLPPPKTSTTSSCVPLCCLPVTVDELPLCPPKGILYLSAGSHHPLLLQGVTPARLFSPQHHQSLLNYSHHTAHSYFSHLQNELHLTPFPLSVTAPFPYSPLRQNFTKELSICFLVPLLLFFDSLCSQNTTYHPGSSSTVAFAGSPTPAWPIKVTAHRAQPLVFFCVYTYSLGDFILSFSFISYLYQSLIDCNCATNSSFITHSAKMELGPLYLLWHWYDVRFCQ